MSPRRLTSALLIAASLASAALASATPCAEPEKIPVLIISGANNHDWERSSPIVLEMLERSGRFEVEVAYDAAAKLADAEGLARFEAIFLDYNARDRLWSKSGERNFLSAVEQGTGVVVLHAADNAFPGWVEYEKLVGHCWRKGTGHGRFHSFHVGVLDRTHPITRGLPDMFDHPDELYHKLVHMHDAQHQVLATAYSDPATGGTGNDEPMATVGSYGKGRVFHCVLGHVWKGQNTAAFEDPQLEQLIVRGTEWAATGEVQDDAGPNQLSEIEKRQGWQLLFDGKTTAAWRGFKREAFPEKGWVAEDGALRCVARGGGGDISTVEQYRDFEFTFEWKVAKGANSGVMYRVTEDNKAPWHSGVEYQVFDDAAYGNVGALTAAGSMYALVPASAKKLMPTGEWNTGRILVYGEHVEHWLNGIKVAEAELDSEDWAGLVAKSKFHRYPGFSRKHHGHLVLQDHGNDVWFRDLKIRRLAKRPATSAKPVELFNGKDLSGLTCFLKGDATIDQVWSVDKGVLVCKGKPAGYIRTETDYTSYILEVEWRFSPVTRKPGNSGVLLRKIGPEKVWPRSIEAQLMSGSAGDFWNIGEFPMKAAPNRTRGRNTRKTHGNERPIGEWNQYEIYVNGGHVALKVNGQVLNEAWDAMITPGKICLQSEGAEIHFRKVRLQPLGGE